MENIIGKKFGKLTVIDYVGKDDKYHKKYLCKCDCGKQKIIAESALLHGQSKSCGCMRAKDLTGKRFGQLTVLEKTDKRYYGYVVWKCKCDCGNITEVPMHNLSYNNMVKSCGCMLKKNQQSFNKAEATDTRYVIMFSDGTFYKGAGTTHDLQEATCYLHKKRASNIMKHSKMLLDYAEQTNTYPALVIKVTVSQ